MLPDSFRIGRPGPVVLASAVRAQVKIGVRLSTMGPAISLASSARIIEPMNAKKAWMFKTPQTDTMMVLAILEHAASKGPNVRRRRRR